MNRANLALSTVIGTDKKGALSVYALSGDLIQSMPVGGVNNVDLRHDFLLDGERVTLVTAGNIDRGSLEVFAVDPRTRRLRDVAARTIGVGEDVYGSCRAASPTTRPVSSTSARRRWPSGVTAPSLTRVLSARRSTSSAGQRHRGQPEPQARAARGRRRRLPAAP